MVSDSAFPLRVRLRGSAALEQRDGCGNWCELIEPHPFELSGIGLDFFQLLAKGLGYTREEILAMDPPQLVQAIQTHLSARGSVLESTFALEALSPAGSA